MADRTKLLAAAVLLAALTSLHCGSAKTCGTCDPNATCVEGACVCNAGFTGPGATCHPAMCPGFTVAHAAVTVDAGVATTTCDPGYTASGLATRTCQADDTWGGAAPSCAPNPCGPALTAPAHGSVSMTTGVTGDVVTYACEQGYTVTGESTRTCLDSGQWSGTAPTCAEMMSGCTPNPCLHSASCTPMGTTGYRCGVSDPGWSGTNCDVPITCSGVVAPSNGTLSATTAMFGQMVTYACSQGYTLMGAATRTCQADGTFSGAAPTCNANPCTPDLVAPANGAVTRTMGVTGDVATFSCNQNFALSGSATLTCLATGAWSGTAPSCAAVTSGCNPNPCVHSAGCTVMGAGYSCGTCDAGWSGANCDVPVSCSGAAAPVNGTVSSGSATFNGTVTYACNAGFTLNGSATRTCQASGTFSGSPPTCAPVSCGAPPAVANSVAPTVSGGAGGGATPTFGATAAYACGSGYGQVGANPICGATGQWSMAPSCVASCGTHTDVVYRVTGTFAVTNTFLMAGNQTFNGLTANATTPVLQGMGDTTPFSRPPPPGGTTFTNAFVRLRFTNDAAGNPTTGAVSLVEWYFPIEATQTAGANLTINVDHSVGLLDGGPTNCGGGDPACINRAPALQRPCVANASGTFTGTRINWGACMPAPTMSNSWSFMLARGAMGPGCATGYTSWGNVRCNSGCAFVPATGLGDSFQSWSQQLTTFDFDGGNPAAAAFNMGPMQIPNGTGSALNLVTITYSSVHATQCGSTPGADLTCTVQ